MSNLSDKPWLVPGHMYQYDIGWLVKKLLSFETELNTAIDLKTIHYADPIQWDITTQYSPNTVVVDPKTGTAYMSKVPVPAGVLLTNTDYWVVIFNYQRIYDKIMSGVAFNDKDNLNATKDLLINDLVWFGGDLYRCTRAIPKGTTYLPGTNLTPTTIADCLATYYGRDRVAQVLNDTVNVSGDYTLNAGDIAETASHVTIHSTQDMLLDADGNLTEQVAGGKTTEVGGKLTEQVTGSREIDVDGDDSINVAGVTSINRGGAVTEVYSSSVDKRVTGAFTESFDDTATSTFNDKRIIKAKDVDVTAESYVIQFPNKKVDLANLSIKTLYKSVSDMISDTDLKINDVVGCAYNNNMQDMTFWIITVRDTESLTKKSLKNGLSAVLLNTSDPVNVLGLGITNNGVDISTDIQYLLDNGYTNLYFPAGTYVMSITIPDNTIIKGAGDSDTKFYASNHGVCLTLNGYFIHLSDFHIWGTTPHTENGIMVSEHGCEHSTFENIIIENCFFGWHATGDMIWNKFYNVNFFGCMSRGFSFASTTGYFNLNTFYSCRFNNNVNYGIYIDATDQHNYCNNFIGCNIEQNCKDMFGKTHEVSYAVYNSAFINFIGCYFEHNCTTLTESTVKNYDMINFDGCIFIAEQNIVNTENVNTVVFKGCTDYQISGNYVTNATGNAFVSFLGNKFSKSINGARSNDYLTNRKTFIKGSSDTIDGSYVVTYTDHTAINSIINVQDGQILVLMASVGADVVIAANIMYDSGACTITKGTARVFVVEGGKLVRTVV